MAALITLEQAKQHLNETTNDRNAEIQLKAELATDIVLDYLKGRQLTISTLTRSGAVATVTTRHLHGLTTGDLVVLRGADQPEYNSTFAVTVTSTTEFTIAVTGEPDTPGTGPMAARAPATWTQTTVPKPVQAAVFLALGYLIQGRGDDMTATSDEAFWGAIERLLRRFRDPAYA